MATFVGMDLNGYSRAVHVATYDSTKKTNPITVYKVGKKVGGYDDRELDEADDKVIEAIQCAKVLAIDAPLGYPKEYIYLMADLPSLYTGRGNHIRRYDDLDGEIFWRKTENYIAQELHVKPLSVAAGNIAFVALRAMRLILRLKQKARNLCVVPFNDMKTPNQSIIEVYPAATLAYRGMRGPYKSKKHHAALERNYRYVKNEFFPNNEILLRDFDNDDDATDRLPLTLLNLTDDILDALICLYLAKEYAEENHGHVRAAMAGTTPNRIHRTEGLIYY